MTRIGFAYNEKPAAVDPHVASDADAESPYAEEEPPSKARDAGRAMRDAHQPRGRGHALHEPFPHHESHVPHPADEFAEWDSEETIAAVERALAGLGEVVRLEANADFPERLRATQPDIVFNMAEGLRGVNREAHVPAICEFFGIPYSASDPFTLSLCLDKARTKEVLAYNGVATAAFSVVRGRWEQGSGNGEQKLRAESRFPVPRSRFPVFVKPIHEGSSKGITEASYCRTQAELDAQVEFLLERYEQPVLIEEYLPGAEFTCAVLGNGDDARVLPLVGMNF